MKKVFLSAAAAAVMLTLLTGCGDTTTAEQPYMMYYNADYSNNTGIINTAGVMLAPPDSAEKTILYQDGKQAYLCVKESIYDKENRNQWDEPTCIGVDFSFYAPDGSLIRTLSLPDKGEVNYYPDSEDALAGVFLCNNIDAGNTVEVLNCEGTPIITIQPDAQDCYGYAGITTGSKWLMLSADFYSHDTNDCIYSERTLYTRDGELLDTAQDYTNIWRIYDFREGYNSQAYYQAYYETADGYAVADIIDENATVILSGITDCYHYQDNLLIIEKDGKRGLIDLEGNWLYYETPDGRTMTAESTPADGQQPEVMNFYGYNGTGIINTAGQMILPPDDLGKFTVTDDNGNTQYIYTVSNYFDYQNPDRWGSPRITGAEYAFYATDGQLIKKLDLRDKGEISIHNGNTPDDCIFLCNPAEQGGDPEVIGGDGTTILTIPLDIPEDSHTVHSYAYMTVYDNWLCVDYNCNDYRNGSYTQLITGSEYYTTDGQPMQFAQDYSSIWEIWDYNGEESTESGYYRAGYANSQGKYLIDILDSQGNTVLTGLSYVGNYHDGLLVCERGIERGLMDIRNGDWIYRESVFGTLDD